MQTRIDLFIIKKRTSRRSIGGLLGEFYVSERYPFPLASVPSRRRLENAIENINAMVAYITQTLPLAN
jgi:hypothetical protein